MPAELDILLKGGRIVDGTGAPWFRSDVGISRGNIEYLGQQERDARRVIYVKDRVVSPGFIDTHQHSDLTLLLNGRAESMVRQGVTTVFVGLCGLSAAPLTPEHIEDWKALLAGVVAHYAIAVPRVIWNWTTTRGYLAELKARGISQNVGTFVGHSAVRAAAMGTTNKTPTPGQMKTMKAMVGQAMREGAFGLSTGLDFSLGKSAGKEEIVELARVAGRYGGLYCSHQRSGTDMIVEATEESIEIAERSGARLIISHLVPKLGAYGKGPELIKLVEEARKRGLDAVFDDYFEIGSPISVSSLFPPWVFEGGVVAMIDRLRERKVRDRIKKEFVGPLSIVVREERWDLITIAAAKNKDIVGKHVLEIAKARRADPWDVIFDIVADEKASAEFVTYFRSGDDGKLMIANPYSIIETDTCCSAPYGDLKSIHDYKSYNMIAKIIRTFYREQNILTLEELIRKMTSLPALTFGLRNRGILREGFAADLVVMDPGTVCEEGTFADPVHYPKGFEYVIINGKPVVQEGKHTGRLPGEILLGSDSIHWKNSTS